MVRRGGRWLTVLMLVLLIASSTAAMDRHAEHLVAQLHKRPACSALIVVRLSFASDELASHANVCLRPSAC